MSSTPARCRASPRTRDALDPSVRTPQKSPRTPRGNYRKTIISYDEMLQELKTSSDEKRMKCIVMNKKDMSRCTKGIDIANYEETRSTAIDSIDIPFNAAALLGFDSLVSVVFCQTHCVWKMVQQLLAHRLAEPTDGHPDHPDSGLGMSESRKAPLRIELHSPAPVMKPLKTSPEGRTRRLDAPADDNETDSAQVSECTSRSFEDEACDVEEQSGPARNAELDNISENMELDPIPSNSSRLSTSASETTNGGAKTSLPLSVLTSSRATVAQALVAEAAFRAASSNTTIPSNAKEPLQETSADMTNGKKEKDVYNALRDVIMKRIQGKYWEQQATGFVYVLSTRQKQGSGKDNISVKIGVTAGSVKERLEGIKKKCNLYDLEIFADNEQRPVPGFFRVEALVHTELKHSQLKVTPCPLDKAKLGKSVTQELVGKDVEELDGHTHREWFNVPPHEALKVVQRWRSSMLQQPYDGEGFLKTEFRWRLNGVILPPPLPSDYRGRDRILRTLLRPWYTPYVWQFIAGTIIHRVLSSPIASLMAVFLNMCLRDIEAEYDVAWMINGMILCWWRFWKSFKECEEDVKRSLSSAELCETAD